MVIAPDNATGALGAIQDDVSGFSVHGETDKARSLRTKHGSLGCGGRRRRAPHRRGMIDNNVLLLLTKIQWSRQ
jgi:hypothetical protein